MNAAVFFFVAEDVFKRIALPDRCAWQRNSLIP